MRHIAVILATCQQLPTPPIVTQIVAQCPCTCNVPARDGQVAYEDTITSCLPLAALFHGGPEAWCGGSVCPMLAKLLDQVVLSTEACGFGTSSCGLGGEPIYSVDRGCLDGCRAVRCDEDASLPDNLASCTVSDSCGSYSAVICRP